MSQGGDLGDLAGIGPLAEPRPRVPFQRPTLPPLDEIERYFAASREIGWYSNFGPCHTMLGGRAAGMLGGRTVVPVANAGIGLIVALRALVPGASVAREVLLPSFTFAATAAAVAWCGLEPVFCEVDPEGWHLCPSALERALDERGERVAAIIACSAFGTPPDQPIATAWSAAADRAGVPLLVDSAAGLGADWTGPAPDAEVFSLHATKPLAIGEGGLIALRDDGLAKHLRVLVNHGLDGQEPVTIGLNGKLDEWHAATALAALDRMEEALAARRAVVDRMSGHLKGHGVRLQAGFQRSPAQFLPILAESPAHRSEILKRARAERVELRTYYSPALHLSMAYGTCRRVGALDVTAALAARIVSLPVAEDLTQVEQDRVLSCLAR